MDSFEDDETIGIIDYIKANDVEGLRGLLKSIILYQNSFLTGILNPSSPEADATPLVSAIKNNSSLDIISILVGAGADVDVRTSDELKTPLVYAVEANNMDAVENLIVMGADVSVKTGPLDSEGSYTGPTALEVAESKSDEERNQDIISVLRDAERIKESYDAFIGLLDTVGIDSIDAITEKLQTMFDQGHGDVLTIRDRNGASGLMHMIMTKDYSDDFQKIYQVLSDEGGPEIADFAMRGRTPLMMFIIKNHIFEDKFKEFITLLCNDSTNINQRDLFGMTALDYATLTLDDEYPQLIKTLKGDAKEGKELGLVDNPMSVFMGEETYEPNQNIVKYMFTPGTSNTPFSPYAMNVTPGPVTPGPVTPGPVTPGPVTPGPVTPGPVTSTPVRRADTPMLQSDSDDDDDYEHPQWGRPPRMGDFDLSDDEEPESPRNQWGRPPRMGDFDLSDNEEETIDIETIPDDPEELKTMYENTVKNLAENITTFKYPSIIKKIKRILAKNPSLINQELSFTTRKEYNNILLIDLVLEIPIDYDNEIFDFIEMCKSYDTEIRKDDGISIVLKKGVTDSNIYVVYAIIQTYGKIINEGQLGIIFPEPGVLVADESDYLKLYNIGYDVYSNNNPDSASVLKVIYHCLFNTVLYSNSDKNYELLPTNIVKGLFEFREFFDEKPEFQVVCLGKNEDGTVIKNSDKILEFLLRNGVYAFKEPNSYIKQPTSISSVIFQRDPSLGKKKEMVKLLLEYGAQLNFSLDEEGNYEIITSIKKIRDEEDDPAIKAEYDEIIKMIYSAIALQIILLTPYIENNTDQTEQSGGDTAQVNYFENDSSSNRDKILKELADKVPDAFSYYPKPDTTNQPKTIDPDSEGFDIMMYSDEKISEFLDEDPENHIVLQDYDKPESTFLIDIRNIKKGIDVDFSPLGEGEIDEDTVDIYDPQNPDIVPGPGKRGGSAVTYRCNSFLEGATVETGNVNNMLPYFDIKTISTIGGLVPLMELYDKILIKPHTERGQYFHYKFLPDEINPLAAVSSVQFLNFIGRNRYGGMLNYVSASHCQEGQYGTLITIIPATPLKKGGKKKAEKGKKTKTNKKNTSKKGGTRKHMKKRQTKTVKKRIQKKKKKTLRKK